MVTKAEQAIRTGIGFFIGGAAGCVLDYFNQAHGKFTQIDFHEMLISAGGMGVIGVLTHYMTPPNQPVK